MATWLGRYRLLSRIGAGTVGEVFRAKIFGVEGFEKVLAVKRLLPELGAHAAVVEAFARAAQDELRLSHANVVQVLDVGRTEEPGPPSFYLAMELVAGVDLGTLLAAVRARGGDVPVGLVSFVGAEVAKALDHAHRRRDDKGRPLGLVHGGLGPTNVLLSWEGEVKVSDFGLARAITVAPPGEVVTAARARRLAYESPEQAAGEPPSARADLYALGAILHEILAGSVPLAGGAAPGVPASVPDALADVVARLLAMDPRDRPADAGVVHDELLGYAYASGERFGAADLADLMDDLHGVDRGRVVAPEALLADDDPSADDPAPADGSPREVAVIVLAGAPSDATSATIERLGAPLVPSGADELAAFVPLDLAPARVADHAVRAALAHVGARAPTARAAGLASGPIAIDADGIPERGPALDALLDASRALAHTAGGHVIASARTLEACGPSLSTDELPGAASADGGARAEDDDRDPFVGRTRELGRLGAALTDATAGRSRVVTVFGPAGVGKTRLVREALRRLEKGRHDVGVVATACPSGGAAAPWSSAIALIGALCGLGAGADDDRLLEAAARLRALGVTDDDADGVLAAIGTAPGAAIDEPRDGNLVARAFARAIRSLCRDRAHVFAWDAAEALDAWTADALADLADERDGLRALVVLASREAPLASFARDDHHLALELGELDLDDTARLIAARLGARVVPANVLAACRARGGGAPRALEDAARELVAAGAITLQDGVAALDAERASAGS